MAKTAKADTTAKVRTLDFTGVKDRGQFNPRHREPGEYLARIVAVEEGTSKNDNPQLIFTIQVEGDKRASYPLYCGLDQKSLWKLRSLITAVGLPTPSGRAKVNPNSLLNKVFGVLLEDDEYEGRVKSKVQDWWPKDEGGPYENAGASSAKKGRVVEDDDEDDDDEEDDEPPARKPAKKAAKKAPVVEEDDEDEEDDEEDEDEEPAPKKASKKAPAKASKKRAPEPEDDDEDEDDDEEDEDDEPEPPKKAAKKAPAKVAKKSRRRASDDDDDDLDTDDL